MGVSRLPKTVTRQRRGCDDLNPGRSAPESSTLTTRLGYRANPTKQLAFIAEIRRRNVKLPSVFWTAVLLKRLTPNRL